MIRQFGALCLALVCTLLGLTQAEPVGDLLQKTGVTGGLVVVVGCAEPELLVQLHASDAFLVQGLDSGRSKVRAARAYVRDKDLCGKISIREFDGRGLPYTGNLVNLAVINCRTADLASELVRVLAPRGVAVVNREGNEVWLARIPYAKTAFGDKIVFSKPVPPDIDDWTHFLHGPDNNALAEDKVVGPPRHMQWRAGPLWGRHHDAEKGAYPTLRNLLSSQGRLICLVDQTRSSDMTVPSQWALVARDAFSGVRLWERTVQVKAMTDYKPKWGLEEVWRQLVLDDGYVLYTALAPSAALCALDINTGRLVRSYPGTAGFRELIKADERLLFVMPEQRVMAVNARTGQALWQWPAGPDGEIVRATLAAGDGRVFVKTERAVVCLSTEQGRPLWRRELAQSERKLKLYFPRERLIVKDKVVLVSFAGKDPQSLNRDAYEFLGSHPRVREYDGRLAALSAESGEILWTANYFPNLEGAPGEIYVTDKTVWLGPDFSDARDLYTGQLRQHRPIIDQLWTDGHHYRCYPGKATCEYILTAKRGIEFIDLDGERHSRNNWVRGTCRVGVLPCNGLLYAPPHSCGCFTEAMLKGLWALAAQTRMKDEGGRMKAEDRLERGPAYQSIHPSSFLIHPSDDWPTLRHDNQRSGSTIGAAPAGLAPAWHTELGGRLSAVTVAGGRVFVAQIDAHTVHALDAASGRKLWQYTAGGRVDSPPTVYQGLVLFGSADGYVYCVRATDGVLAWRFLAAPAHLQAVAFDQIESVWPVHGSVLVHTGPGPDTQAVAYVSAGRSSYLDGGIWLYGLDPMTGSVIVQQCLQSDEPDIIKPPINAGDYAKKISQNTLDYKTFLAADRSDAFSMAGALTDVLVADGDSIFMRHLRLNGRLEPQADRRTHLYAVSSLLDDYGHNRADWLLGSGNLTRLSVAFPWYAKRNHLAVAHGLCLSFDDRTVWSIRQTEFSRVKPVTYVLRGESRPGPADLDVKPAWPPPKQAKAIQETGSDVWSLALAFQPRAVVRAGAQVVTGGRKQGQGVIQVVDARKGKLVNRRALPASPVWDGLAIAGGRLYLAREDGGVQCMKPARTSVPVTPRP